MELEWELEAESLSIFHKKMKKDVYCYTISCFILLLCMKNKF